MPGCHMSDSAPSERDIDMGHRTAPPSSTYRHDSKQLKKQNLEEKDLLSSGYLIDEPKNPNLGTPADHTFILNNPTDSNRFHDYTTGHAAIGPETIFDSGDDTVKEEIVKKTKREEILKLTLTTMLLKEIEAYQGLTPIEMSCALHNLKTNSYARCDYKKRLRSGFRLVKILNNTVILSGYSYDETMLRQELSIKYLENELPTKYFFFSNDGTLYKCLSLDELLELDEANVLERVDDLMLKAKFDSAMEMFQADLDDMMAIKETKREIANLNHQLDSLVRTRGLAFNEVKRSLDMLNLLMSVDKVVDVTNLDSKLLAKLAENVNVIALSLSTLIGLQYLQFFGTEIKKLLKAIEQKQDRRGIVSGHYRHEHEKTDRRTSLVEVEASQQLTETNTYYNSFTQAQLQPAVCVEPNVIQGGISSDEHILHMDIEEFAARINEEADQEAESDPIAEPHDVIRRALGNVLRNGVGEKEGDEVLCIVDSEDHSIELRTKTTLLCHVDGDAVKKLGSDTQTGGAECFEHFLEESANRIHDTRTKSYPQSDGQLTDSSSNDFNVTERKKIVHDRNTKYPEHRILFKGPTWTKEDDQQAKYSPFQTATKKRNNPSKKKFVKMSTNNGPIKKSIHVVSAEESSSDSNSDNASDVVSLTDFCSVCSTDSYRQ